MASARSSSSVLTNPECFTVSGSNQCYTEVNEVPLAGSEIVTGVTKHMHVEWDDKKTELVTGKECFSFMNSLNSELVVK